MFSLEHICFVELNAKKCLKTGYHIYSNVIFAAYWYLIFCRWNVMNNLPVEEILPVFQLIGLSLTPIKCVFESTI